MSAEQLHEALERVSNSEELADFIDALRHDLVTNANDWQNTELKPSLEVMSAWLRDMERAKKHRGELPLASLNPFRLCAEVLCAAKHYE